MKSNRKREVVQVILFLLLAVFLFFAMPRYVAERIIVDGDSMETTLKNNDNIIIEKLSKRFGSYNRFDIIVFYPTEEAKKQEERYYVKRIIGLPGETVQILYGMVYIDGRPLPENYGSSEMDHAGIAADPITLGPDEYFVLGDNRYVSEDSRSAKLGPVPAERIEGRMVLRISPLKRFGTVE